MCLQGGSEETQRREVGMRRLRDRECELLSVEDAEVVHSHKQIWFL